jgi:hypothetical protein
MIVMGSPAECQQLAFHYCIFFFRKRGITESRFFPEIRVWHRS